MNTVLGERPKTPWHLWVIGIVSLLWNSAGAASYSMTELGMLEGMDIPPDQLEFLANFPAWAVATWALGVWGCFFGSIALLLRSRWAVLLFGVWIVGLIGTTVYQRLVTELPASMQGTGNDVFSAAIWVITFALFIYANRMRRAGVLR